MSAIVSKLYEEIMCRAGLSESSLQEVVNRSRADKWFLGTALRLFMWIGFFNCLAFLMLCTPKNVIAAGGSDIAPEPKNVAQIRYDDESERLHYPSAVFYDSYLEEIYLVNGATSRIIVYGPGFFPRMSIGAGRGVFAPQGGYVTADGKVYICQQININNPRARITVLNGAFFVEDEIFLDEIPEAAEIAPKRIAVSEDGLIYLVGEYYRGVLVLDTAGNFLRRLQPQDEILARYLEKYEETRARIVGTPEEDEQEEAEESDESESEDEEYANIPEEYRPIDKDSIEAEAGSSRLTRGPVLVNNVTIDSNGRLYFLSQETSKVYVYDSDETFLFSFGTKGGSPGQLSNPRGLAVDLKNELIYVADYMRHSILAYTLEGEYIFEIGGRGLGVGWFNYPIEITLNKHGHLIVADLFNRRVQVLDLEYKYYKELLEKSRQAPNLEDVTAGEDALRQDEPSIEVQEESVPFDPEVSESFSEENGAVEVILEEEKIPTIEEQEELGPSDSEGSESLPEENNTIEVILENEEIPAIEERTN